MNRIDEVWSQDNREHIQTLNFQVGNEFHGNNESKVTQPEKCSMRNNIP